MSAPAQVIGAGLTEARGQQLIVGCLATSAAIAAASTLAEGDAPGVRMLTGVTVTAIGLGTLNMFAPALAGSFAVLVLTTTVFVYGGPAFDAVTRLTKEPKPTFGSGAAAGFTYAKSAGATWWQKAAD